MNHLKMYKLTGTCMNSRHHPSEDQREDSIIGLISSVLGAEKKGQCLL